MARPKLDLARKVKDILRHTGEMAAEADRPLHHFERTINDLWNLREYAEQSFRKSGHYQAVADRHLIRLNAMVLLQAIETFERFLKECAAVCVNELARFTLDSRFDRFNIRGSVLAVHFGSPTLGKSLCEAETWLDCDQVNDRFRALLADPFESGSFYIFPKSGNQEPKAEQWRFEVASILWQIRHTIVHNVGVITQSDAIKLRLLAKEGVASECVLLPSRDDLRYVIRFLGETAESIANRVGERLAQLLTTIHVTNPSLFDPAMIANQLSATFNKVLKVAGIDGVIAAR